MGSKVTADERVMRIVLSVCRECGLFFLDSRTSYRSVIPRVADELGVPKTANNHLFLDEVYTTSRIVMQVLRFRKHTHDHNHCIIIGHVGPPGKKTAQALHDALPVLTREMRIVPLSRLVADQQAERFPGNRFPSF